MMSTFLLISIAGIMNKNKHEKLIVSEGVKINCIAFTFQKFCKKALYIYYNKIGHLKNIFDQFYLNYKNLK